MSQSLPQKLDAETVAEKVTPALAVLRRIHHQTQGHPCCHITAIEAATDGLVDLLALVKEEENGSRRPA